MEKFIVRQAEEKDLDGIVLLRQSIREFRPIERDEYISFWTSIIRHNPVHIQNILVAENERGKIIAHYAMIPFKFVANERMPVGGFLCQLMVHDDYRNKLVFPRMELTFLKEYKNQGFDFIYGMGKRETVVKAHVSFGLRVLGTLQVYAKPYKLAGISRRYIQNKTILNLARPFLFVAERMLQLRKCFPEGSMEISEIPRFDATVDDLFLHTQEHFSYLSLRNAVILNWRFGGYEGVRYHNLVARDEGRIIGYVVLRRMEMNGFDVLAIVDILFSPERIDVGKSLLNAVHKIAKKTNVEMSACLLNPQSPFYPLIKTCGYYRTPETFSFFAHEQRWEEHHFSAETFSKWHLTWFDNDSV